MRASDGSAVVASAAQRRTTGLAASRRILGVVVLTVGVGLSLAAGVAQAKLVFYRSFGSGKLSLPPGVAVDQASRCLRHESVLPISARALDEFDASGDLISPPSPFGSGYYIGHGGRSHQRGCGALDVRADRLTATTPRLVLELSSCSVLGGGGRRSHLTPWATCMSRSAEQRGAGARPGVQPSADVHWVGDERAERADRGDGRLLGDVWVADTATTGSRSSTRPARS